MAQVIKYLPSKCETLSSNPSTTKKKKAKNLKGMQGVNTKETYNILDYTI
jgi:hypothetical protein